MPDRKDTKPTDDAKQSALPPSRATGDCGRFRMQAGPRGDAPLNTLVLGRRFVFSC